MEMNQVNFNKFDKAFKEAVKGLEETFGVTIKQGGGSYTKTSFTSKLTVTTTEQVDGKSVEQVEFERIVSVFSEFTKDDYLMKFELYDRGQHRQFELYGLNSRAPKNACLIRRVSDGAKFKCSVSKIRKPSLMN